MSRQDGKSKRMLMTSIDVILGIIFVVAGVLLTIYQDFGPEFFYIIPAITFILVIAIIVHLMFLWGIKKGVIVDRRRRVRPQPRSSYDPIHSDSYEFTTNDDFLAERPSIAEREEAQRRERQKN